MKIKKISLFKVVNIFMAVFCIGTMCINYTGVNILNNENATSSIGSDIFEYKSTENTFSVHKNGQLLGKLPTSNKITFKSSKPLLQPTAIVMAGKIIAAGFAAAATGGSFAAGVSTALSAALAKAGITLGGAAMAGGAAMVEPIGAGAVAATLGGAGEVAAAAAAADAALIAGGGMAVLSAIIVPVLIGAGVAVGLT